VTGNQNRIFVKQTGPENKRRGSGSRILLCWKTVSYKARGGQENFFVPPPRKSKQDLLFQKAPRKNYFSG
jgi:hypothetical protein